MSRGRHADNGQQTEMEKLSQEVYQLRAWLGNEASKLIARVNGFERALLKEIKRRRRMEKALRPVCVSLEE